MAARYASPTKDTSASRTRAQHHSGSTWPPLKNWSSNASMNAHLRASPPSPGSAPLRRAGAPLWLLIGLLAHALERLAAFLLIREAASVGVALRPGVVLRVVHLAAVLHGALAI